jgi:hypothetical protein
MKRPKPMPRGFNYWLFSTIENCLKSSEIFSCGIPTPVSFTLMYRYSGFTLGEPEQLISTAPF